MIRTLAVSGLLLLGTLAAGAQTALPPVESVVVTGTKSPQALNAFVGSIAVPTRLIGKLARWEMPICPLVSGVNDDAVTFVTRRLRDVAAGAGAPVSDNTKCRPNIQIVFTTEPQALVDDIRKTNRNLLGYYDTYRQLGQMAHFRRPVQAWYMTATQDARGHRQTDTSKGGGIEIDVPGTGLKLQNTAHNYATLGSRLGDGLRANLHYVTIIAEPSQLLEHEMGPVADYISMLALSQMQRLDRCQSLPSIVNLLAKGCANPPGGLTATDKGYLRGLYAMRPDLNLGVQKNEIASGMEKAMVTQ
jgi:hypothetical protein